MALLGFELMMRLLWGSLLTLAFISRVESSERFIRIASHIALGIGLCAALLSAKILAPALLVGGFYLYAWTSGRLPRIAGFLIYSLSPLVFLWGEPLPQWFNFVSSALLLGGMFGGQYLGHWFLNVPGMHIRELQRVGVVAGVGLGAKISELLWTLYQHRDGNVASTLDAMGRPLGIDVSQTSALLQFNPSGLLSLEGNASFGLGLYGVLILSMRVLWGLVAPLILAWMIRETLRIRATQSATGILYAACVMVLVGEGTAIFLKNTVGWFQ
jgi:hypothetical protein